MPFSWFLRARAVSARVESDECLVRPTDFVHCWSCCSLSSPTSASGQPVQLQLSASALAAGGSSFASIDPSSQGLKVPLRWHLPPCPSGLQLCVLLRETWLTRMVLSMRLCSSSTSSGHISRWITFCLWLFLENLRFCSRAWSCCIRLCLPQRNLKVLWTLTI